MLNEGLIKKDSSGSDDMPMVVLTKHGLDIIGKGGWLKHRFNGLTGGQKIHRILQYMWETDQSKFDWTPNELMPAFSNLVEENEIQALCLELIEQGDVADNRSKDGFSVGSVDRTAAALHRKKYLNGQAEMPTGWLSNPLGAPEPKPRIFYALSTSSPDNQLMSRGLINRGLLGYIESSAQSTLAALVEFQLTFPSGEAYFYTLDETKETFEGLSPKQKRTLGFTRNTAATGHHRLHRFFNKKQHHHIFIINPNVPELIASDYRDESNDNPIFVHSHKIPQSLPLFLYSNTPKIFSSTIQSDGDSDSSTESRADVFKNLLTAIIRTENIDQAIFFFSSEEDNDVTVSIPEKLFNFYVNAQDENVFTVKRNPTPEGESYTLTDVRGWSEVEKLFRKWLDSLPASDVRKSSNESSTSGSNDIPKIETKSSPDVYDSPDISIGDSFEVESALDVDTLADEIAKIIKNLRPELGNMIGVFGRWGRGKTRLMNEIWKRLSKNDGPVKFQQVKYQAWRYQDTPASWAYLYEQFSATYLGKKNSPRSFFTHHRRLLWLNIEREGWWSLILAFFFASLSILAVMLWTPMKECLETMASKIGWSVGGGIILSISIKNFRQAYLTKAINIISRYGTKTSFRNTLGIQAEIQKELVQLINAWISDGAKQKILLRVDDLDRCNEEKTIEIIDALRIILDDEELTTKLLVLTAIDERILQTAINHKYAQLEGEENIKKEITREYIDKLFIFSVKLGTLDQAQSKDFFTKLIKKEIETGEGPPSEPFVKAPVAHPVSTQENFTSEKTQELAKQSTPSLVENIPTTSKLNKIKKLSNNEIKLITDHLGLVKNSTPRKIRILYYRYLFAKNLIIIGGKRNDENDYWLSEPNHSVFIKLLIHFSDHDTIEIVNQINAASKGDPVKSPLDSMVLDNVHYFRLLKIPELTIAY